MDAVNSSTGVTGESLGVLATQIRDHLESAKQLYHRLILVVGGPGTGKTTALFQLSKAMGLPYMNVNMSLSQRLLEFTSKARPLRLLKVFDDILRSAGTDIVLADNREICLTHD